MMHHLTHSSIFLMSRTLSPNPLTHPLTHTIHRACRPIQSHPLQWSASSNRRGHLEAVSVCRDISAPRLFRRLGRLPTTLHPKKRQNVAPDCVFVGVHCWGRFVYLCLGGGGGDCVLCNVGKRSTVLGNMWD